MPFAGIGQEVRVKELAHARHASLQRATTLADGDDLAGIRVRFLSSESVEPYKVREAILASWWRSRQFHVPADRIDVPYVPEHDQDTPLIHSAQPVLARLGEQLDGQPISVILTDRSGVVLSQLTGDPDLHRHLEHVQLVPGFSYAEQAVGTNGIGTALEGGRPMHVFGHEHYAENLEDLACAGVPIQHPISGKTIGAVDLTCWRRDAGPLLITLARTTADQIQQAMLTNSGMRELELFQAYLQACRRSTGIVMALNNDVTMMNDNARQLLDPADQSLLLGHASQLLGEGRRTESTVDLPTGTRVRLHCRPIPGRTGIVGGVLHVKLIQPDEPDSAAPGPMLPMFLPGLVGSAPLWLRCCHDVDDGYGRGEWLVLSGERGVGKLALAKGVHQRRKPTGRLHVLDATESTSAGWLAQARREIREDPAEALVIRHADLLTGPAIDGLSTILLEARSHSDTSVGWVALTLCRDAESRPELAELLGLFPRIVQVPPLRHHIEDLRQLVPFFLSKLAGSGALNCAPDAMQLLMRSNWLGNAEQLYRVLRQVAQHRRRTGAIHSGDLPAEYRTITRRKLNQLESMERDAIVQSLQDADGNKLRAAKFLGMSRATIYRKIHEYGIVTPAG
jgi:sigma-54 dependent transcriptional regulator, acetoin dehydrogenase operon transcriptional activator AcoR